jgi:rhodanese-related sulfurtransferase
MAVPAVAFSPRMTGQKITTVHPTSFLQRQHRHDTSILFNVMSDLTYGMRKASFGIEDKDVLKNLVAAAGESSSDNRNHKIVFVDVRNQDEIEQAGLSTRPFVKGSSLLDETVDARNVAKKLLPNKDATHIVFCAKGGRASKACHTLKELGYAKVYNAGGLDDLNLFLKDN